MSAATTSRGSTRSAGLVRCCCCCVRGLVLILCRHLLIDCRRGVATCLPSDRRGLGPVCDQLRVARRRRCGTGLRYIGSPWPAARHGQAGPQSSSRTHEHGLGVDVVGEQAGSVAAVWPPEVGDLASGHGVFLSLSALAPAGGGGRWSPEGEAVSLPAGGWSVPALALVGGGGHGWPPGGGAAGTGWGVTSRTASKCGHQAEDAGQVHVHPRSGLCSHL